MGEGFLIDKVQDKTGMKGTGKWTIQQAAELSVAAPTMEAALDGRFLSGLKDERVAAEALYAGIGVSPPALGSGVDKQQLIEDVRAALYASKVRGAARLRMLWLAGWLAGWLGYGRVCLAARPCPFRAARRATDRPALPPLPSSPCPSAARARLPSLQVCSYAQGYNIIRSKSMEQGWDIDLGGLARIWKGGCIIRAGGGQQGWRARARAWVVLRAAPGLRMCSSCHSPQPPLLPFSRSHIPFSFMASACCTAPLPVLPRRLPGPHQAGLPARPLPAQPAGGPRLRPGPGRPPGSLAPRRPAGSGRGHRRPRHHQLPGLLRHLPPRQAARQPGAGAARLLRLAHLRAHRRPGGLVPHRCGAVRCGAVEGCGGCVGLGRA